MLADMRYAVFLFILLVARAADEKSPPPVQIEELAAPAAPGAVGASLAAAPDGTVWLSWVEPARPEPAERAAGAAHALRFATLDFATKKWRAPRTIASGRDVAASSADFPQLAIGPGDHATAVWTDGHGGAFLSESANQGATWSAPAPFVQDGHEVEKFSLAVLADGRVLVAWLDARAKKSGGKMQQLFARILPAPGLPADLSAKISATAKAPAQAGADMLVDPAVCDCCQTALTAFPDGSALLAYRGRTDGEVRDIRITRFHGNAWDDPRPLNADDWRLAACPVNGPRLASDGGRVAAAWFTAADNDPL